MMEKIYRKIKQIINIFLRKRISTANIKRLKNKNISLIASNCNGCIILNELKCRFNSPFVNLYIEADDFVKLLKDFDYYMSKTLEFPYEAEDYPIGYLDDIKIHFVHYESEESAINNWEDRKNRIDKDNLFIMFTDRDGCTRETLIEFDKLPFENKVVFTKEAYEDIKSAYYIKGFENCESVGLLYEFVGWNGKKYYDEFDYVGWFNSKEKN